jgi:hypothetical protein
MAIKKTDLAIVNRSFWPQGQVIGEALLQFAEEAAEDGSVCVITQAYEDISQKFVTEGRGKNVEVKACKSYTTSSSGFLKRAGEAVLFMFWVFASLVRSRPMMVYVSTNPPVIVPFIVAIYCKFFGAEYVYHLQDIHPEAANIIVPLNRVFLLFLKAMDNFTLRNAKSIVTLSDEMKDFIELRSKTQRPIFLLDNPSFEIDPVSWNQRKNRAVFCGNAGRLQRIPLLTDSIRDYIHQGGTLGFVFAGGGVFSPEIQSLSDSFSQVEYLGVIAPIDAAKLVNESRWALLPIDDQVTKFAFPSKSSGYVLSGTGVIAICNEDTSVGKWVKKFNVGKVCSPDQESLVRCFFSLEKSDADNFEMQPQIRERLRIQYFAAKLLEFVSL